MNQKQQLMEIVNKIKEMERTMFELVEMWDQVDPEVQDELANNFPFNKSFDEVHSDVQQWYETLKEKLNE